MTKIRPKETLFVSYISKLLTPVLMIMLFTTFAFANRIDKNISGKVTDEKGQAIPGVSVLVKGSTKGTITNVSGEYKITVPDASNTLVFSSIGYTKQEITIGEQTEINVSLQPQTSSLDEVVVTALGIEKSAKSLSYSSQKLEGTKFTDVRDGNFANTLSGKVAGLVVTTSAGGPGSASRVVLRGNRSLSGNNNALFVVDGVPIDNSSGNQAKSDFGGFNGSDGISSLNPDDFESVNVLTGAAGAALYGSRAANGVVIITTKKGKIGKGAVAINSGISVESPFLLPSFQNTYGRGVGGKDLTSGESNWGSKSGTIFPNNVRDFFRNAVSLNNSVSFSGGNETIQNYFSYSNASNQGIIPNNSLDRNTFNLRSSMQFNRLSINTKITYINQNINNKIKTGEENGIVMDVYKVPRSIDLNNTYNTYEDANGLPTYWDASNAINMNPYWVLNRTGNTEKRDRIILQTSAKYALTNWLDIQGRYSRDHYNDVNNYFFYNNTLLLPSTGGEYQVANNSVTEQNIDLLLSGKNKINDNWKVNYNIGTALNNRDINFLQTNSGGLQVPNKFDLAFAKSLSVSPTFSPRELQSVYGTAQFALKDYLFVDLTARKDWSSTLPNPYGFFYPSVGITTILSNYLKLPKSISFAKARASYSEVGNDADPFLLNQTYSYSQGAGNGLIYPSNTQALGNLKAELTKALEFGLEARFVNNRYGLNFTYYKSNTYNQLVKVNTARSSGYEFKYINAGNIQNTGFELSLNAKIINKTDFTWDATLNAARNKNEIVEISPLNRKVDLGNGSIRTAEPFANEGGSFGDLYGYVWKRDSKGQFIVSNGLPVISSDYQKLGNSNPNFTLGLNNNFNYKNFNLSFLIDGRFGGIMTNGTEGNLAFQGLAKVTEQNRDANWQIPGVNADGTQNNTKITAEAFWATVTSAKGRYSAGEFFTYDATNIRLREATLGYNVKVPSNFFIKSARISLVARNLFFIYKGSSILDIPGLGKRKMDFDPDVNMGAGNYQGITYGNLPSTRSIGFNLKLGF